MTPAADLLLATLGIALCGAGIAALCAALEG